jgi:hypothetical protein
VNVDTYTDRTFCTRRPYRVAFFPTTKLYSSD